MAFQKFGKLILPIVVSICSLDVLYSFFYGSYYDISYQEPKHLREEGFARNIKNMCQTEIEKISIVGMLNSYEYVEYFLNNHINVKGSNYFPTSGCINDDSLDRKRKEAEAYLEKNLESLQNSYREHLEDAKKYVFADDSYEVKNTYIRVNYDHNYYKESGKINVEIGDRIGGRISVFKIKEVAGKPFKQTQLYIKPTNRQLDFLSKSGAFDTYELKLNIKLDSLKTITKEECDYHQTRRYPVYCIETNLVKAEIVIVTRNDIGKESEPRILIDTIPVEWEQATE